MLIDVVIPYRLSPFTNSLELKYCLRSIDKHLQNVGRVWIIGEKPTYLNIYEGGKCWHIPVNETNWYEYLTRNIHTKILTACLDPVVSNPFLYMNDDHFLLQDMDAELIPPYHSGKTWGRVKGRYHITVRNTLDKFPGTDNYDIHAPMLIYKTDYIETVGKLNWKVPYGYAIKTTYCNLAGIPYGKFYPDYKLDHKPTETDFSEILTRKFFSVGDKGFNNTSMFQFLNQLYPNKSKYEI